MAATRTRTVKTPAERAQEDLDLANRILVKAKARAEKTAAEDKKAQSDLVDASTRVGFLEQNPALPNHDKHEDVL